MSKEVLKITIEPRKQPKTKFGRWWDRKVSYPFYSKKLQFKAWFWGGMYRFAKWIVPDSKHNEVFGLDEEIEVYLEVDEDFHKNLQEAIINEIEQTKND